MARITRNRKLKTWEQLFDDFQTSNKVKNLSEHTITFYDTHVNMLLLYLNESNVKNAHELTIDNINHYILLLKQRYDNSITINSFIRASRVFI